MSIKISNIGVENPLDNVLKWRITELFSCSWNIHLWIGWLLPLFSPPHFWLSRFALLLSRLLLHFTFECEHVRIAGKLWRHCQCAVWPGVVFECHRNAGELRVCSVNWIVITFARWSNWKIGDFRCCMPSSAVGWTFSGNGKFTKREKRLCTMKMLDTIQNCMNINNLLKISISDRIRVRIFNFFLAWQKDSPNETAV